MTPVIVKSVAISIVCVLLALFLRSSLGLSNYLSDVGGLGAFVTVFGTLYGIMAAFVVFEVWNQYNETSALIDEEASGLERMYRLVLYFNDKLVEKAMKKAIFDYAHIVIEGKFSKIGYGIRNPKTGKAFREIFKVIRSIKFDDSRDSTVFPLIVEHSGKLNEVRVKRINQSLARLPIILKLFFFSSSVFVLITFLIMPFSLAWFHAFVVGVIAFLVALTIQLVQDLDNPFVGHFNLTPEPFERALNHIENDY